jgi:hypothetical protein
MPKKTKKKVDLKGKSSGGSEHSSKKRQSTKEKQLKGRATKQKSYGGEKGDVNRELPRRRWRGYKGPWPLPQEVESPPDREVGNEEHFGGQGQQGD